MTKEEWQARAHALEESFASFTAHPFQVYIQDEIGTRIVHHRTNAAAYNQTMEKRAEEAMLSQAATEYLTLATVAYQRASNRVKAEIEAIAAKDFRDQKKREQTEIARTGDIFEGGTDVPAAGRSGRPRRDRSGPF